MRHILSTNTGLAIQAMLQAVGIDAQVVARDAVDIGARDAQVVELTVVEGGEFTDLLERGHRPLLAVRPQRQHVTGLAPDTRYRYRLRKIVAEPGTAIVGYDQDAWCKRLKYQEQDPADVMKEIEAHPNATVHVYKGQDHAFAGA